MTNSFFQTQVHLDNNYLTTVTTLFGRYKWTVMSMGSQNTPTIHQYHIYSTLWHLINDICHVYLDNIIIWSQSMAEHIKNIIKVLDVLYTVNLYCLSKKTFFFCNSVDFLDHHIFIMGIKADFSKV